VRSGTFIGVAAAIVLLIAGAAGVYAYDHAREDKIAEGIPVGGVQVGGLHREEAITRLRDELLRPLSVPIVVEARGKTFHLTAREARISSDIDAMVDDAIARGREGNILSRTWRNVSNREVDERIEPRVTYSSEAVGRLVSRVRRHVDRDAQDARVDFNAGGLEKVAGHTGFRLDRALFRDRVEAALLKPGQTERTVKPPIHELHPEVSTSDLEKKYETAIIVDSGSVALRLYKNLTLEKTYPIAVGMAGLETPAGLYDIENKQVNPYWHVPDSDWAGSLAGQVIPPGPTNPIKARWMGIIGGAGIHGTTDDASIGSNASHGCIRMHIPDVIDLYDRVPVGAAVYIA
jgi:lipoprotein-anchoring transpeptidase ErfK/SrfK